MPILYTLRVFLLCLLIAVISTPIYAQESPPEATAQATAQPLTQTFVSENNLLTFDYPAGWTVIDEGVGAVLLNQTGIDVTGVMASGQLFLVIDTIDKGEFAGLSIDPTPLGFMQLLVEFSDVPIDTPQPFTLEDGRAAAFGSVPGEQEDGLIIVLDSGPDTLVYLSAVSAPGEMPLFTPTLLAIANTVQYQDNAPDTTAEATPDGVIVPQVGVTPGAGGAAQVNVRPPLTELAPALPLPQSYATSDGALIFEYPESWRVVERVGVVAIANSPETEAAVANNLPLQAGQFSMGIYLPAALRDFMDIDVTAPAPEVLLSFVQATSGQTIPSEVLRAFTVGDRAAVRLDIGAATTDGVIMAIPLANGQTVIVTLAAAPGDSAQFEATALAMIATMRPGTGQAILAATPIPNITPANLTQTFGPGASGLSFSYPAGWEVRESAGSIILVNTAEFFTATSIRWDGGQVGVIFYTPTFLGQIGVTDDGDLGAVLSAFLTASGAQETYSTPSTFTANNLTITRIDSTTPQTQRTVWALRLNNQLLIVEAVAGVGYLAQYEPTLLAVLSTAAYAG